MPLAISLIVDGYVRLGDREALETLRAHRVEMLESARSIAEMDTSRMIASLKEEIEIIDAGLSRLKACREEQQRASGGPEATPLNDIARGDPHE